MRARPTGSHARWWLPPLLEPVCRRCAGRLRYLSAFAEKPQKTPLGDLNTSDSGAGFRATKVGSGAGGWSACLIAAERPGCAKHYSVAGRTPTGPAMSLDTLRFRGSFGTYKGHGHR